MSHLIISPFKYKLKLMRVDRRIMHWIMLNWTSLNNTYCQTVYNPVEVFISAFLRFLLHEAMASLVNELTGLSLAIWLSFSKYSFLYSSLLLLAFHFFTTPTALFCNWIVYRDYLSAPSRFLGTRSVLCCSVFSLCNALFLHVLADTCSGLCLFGSVPSHGQAQPWVYCI